MANYEFHKISPLRPIEEGKTFWETLEGKGIIHNQRIGDAFNGPVIDYAACGVWEEYKARMLANDHIPDEDIVRIEEGSPVFSTTSVHCPEKDGSPDQSSVVWTRRWVEDNRPAMAISKAFPDTIFKYTHQYELSAPISLHVKNGEWVNELGRPVLCAAYSVPKSLIKRNQYSGIYRIRMNMGKDRWGMNLGEDHYWVTIHVDEWNVEPNGERMDILFTDEYVPVYCGAQRKDIKAEDFCAAYHEAKDAYREKMSTANSRRGDSEENKAFSEEEEERDMQR